MPATATWRGLFSTDADDHRNWSGLAYGTLPGQYDHLVFTAQPTGGMPPTMQSAPNCDGLDGTFSSIETTSGYTNTVTFEGAVTIGAFVMAGGAISQPTSGTDLTVTFYFQWTAGTLNSSSHLANVTITGNPATALFAPAGGGTVNTGSNITLAAGAHADFEVGTYNFTNNGEVNVGQNCGADVNTATVSSTVKYVGVNQINLAGTDSIFRVSGPGTLDGTGVPFYNSDGLVDITSSVTVKLGGTVTVLGNTHESSYYQNGTNARLHIQNGSNLVVEKTAKITDGVLKTFYNSNLADNVTAQTATLTGDLWVSGGVVDICVKEALQPKHYGTFYVTETAYMSGGTYTPGIDSTTSGKNDHWESGKNFTVSVGNTATLTPRNSNGANTVANGVWNIIKSRTGTYSGAFATTNLQYTAGPPAKSYTFNTGGSPVNQVNLTS